MLPLSYMSMVLEPFRSGIDHSELDGKIMNVLITKARKMYGLRTSLKYD